MQSPPPIDAYTVDPLTSIRPPNRTHGSDVSVTGAARDQERDRVIREFVGLYEQERAAGAEPTIQRELAAITGYPIEHLRRLEAVTQRRHELEALAAAGDTRSWRPTAYMLLALFGRCAIGFGAILLEHLILPGQPKDPNTADEGGERPMGKPPVAAAPSPVSIMGGTILVVAGATAALAATYLFWSQAKIANPRRARINAAAHVTSLSMVIAHSFLSEWMLFNRPQHEQAYASVLSIISIGVYCYTVPNSFTAAEMQLGLTPVGSLDTRDELASVSIGIGAALYVTCIMLSARPNVVSYAKQATLIGATIFLTIGVAFKNTNARSYKAREWRGRQRLEERRLSIIRRQSAAEEGSVTARRRPTALPEAAGRQLLGLRPPLITRRHSTNDSQVHILAETPTVAPSEPQVLAAASRPPAFEPDNYFDYRSV